MVDTWPPLLDHAPFTELELGQDDELVLFHVQSGRRRERTFHVAKVGRLRPLPVRPSVRQEVR